MTTFKDNEGRTWTLSIHVTAINKCRAHGLDLYGLLSDDGGGLGALVSDPIRLVGALYLLCEDEATRRGVDEDEFGRGMRGDVIATAADAFVEELIGFFPDPRVREGLKAVMAKSRKVTEKVIDHIGRLVDQMNPDDLANELIASSGNLPAPSASTPAPSPSASSP